MTFANLRDFDHTVSIMTTMTTPPRTDVTPSVLESIRRMVADVPFVMVFPAGLAHSFAGQRQKEFERLVRLGAPAAIIFCLLIIASGHFGFGGELSGEAGRVWWWVAIINTSLVVLAASSLLFAACRLNYQIVMGLTGGGIMISTMLLSIVLDNARLAQSMTYVVMLLITIVTLALRLSVLTAALSCLLGGIVGIILAWSLYNLRPDWWQLLHYYVGSLGVSLFVAWMLERQERISFLKSILLEHEAGERDRLNRELARLARQDALTGLANRRCFDERLVQEWERSQRARHELALLFIDVDHFKKYNDNYGHSAGDDCLAAVAGAIGDSLLRPADLASRYGGEEFVVLLPETTREGALEVAERIQAGVAALKMPHAASSTADHVTVSIGLTSCIPESGLAQALVDAADSALYAAKHAGRNRIMSAHESEALAT